MLGNSIIITIILGLAVGYDSMTDSDKGKAFLSGTWAINEQLLPFWKANSLYYLMQFACLASSMTVCQVLVHLLKEQGRIVTFFLSNIGAFLCGYCYSGQAWKLLYSYGIIREII